MSGVQFLKNRLGVILLNVCGYMALALFLAAQGDDWQSIGLIGSVWLVVLCLFLVGSFLKKRRYLEQLVSLAEQMPRRYLLPEVMKLPEQAELQSFYKLMVLAEKSMLEEIGAVRREQNEYREFIEQWIHEIKTPVAAMKLLCENHRDAFSRELLAQLERVDRLTETTLYYARAEHAEKDYRIRETDLAAVIHEAVGDNRYLLRQNGVAVSVELEKLLVYTDEKWVRFILSQLIVNAVKYRKTGDGTPKLCFSARKQGDQVVLLVEDNGMGVPSSDLPRLFEKGFTGENGRQRGSSTGLGLYLCKELCAKLGIGLQISSGPGETLNETGTQAALFFQINHFVTEVQG